MPRLKALSAYWDSSPPQHIQLARIAAFLGIKTGKNEDAQETPDGQITELMQTFPTGELPKVMTPEEYLAKMESQAQGGFHENINSGTGTGA